MSLLRSGSHRTGDVRDSCGSCRHGPPGCSHPVSPQAPDTLRGRPAVVSCTAAKPSHPTIPITSCCAWDVLLSSVLFRNRPSVRLPAAPVRPCSMFPLHSLSVPPPFAASAVSTRHRGGGARLQTEACAAPHFLWVPPRDAPCVCIQTSSCYHTRRPPLTSSEVCRQACTLICGPTTAHSNRKISRV